MSDVVNNNMIQQYNLDNCIVVRNMILGSQLHDSEMYPYPILYCPYNNMNTVESGC